MDISSYKQKTLLGYHDKNVNKFGLINPKSLPIFIEERYAPFLITRDYILNISTDKILLLIDNFKALTLFRSIKIKIANLLVVPGLLISIMYILRATGLLEQVQFVETMLSNKIINLGFWLSVLGILILWHDYYRTRSHPVRLPQAPAIPTKEIEDIKTTGFKFGRYSQLEVVYFLSEESQELLANSVKNKAFNSYEVFKEIINSPLVEEVIKRSSIDLTLENHSKYQISKITLPSYTVLGLRNILIYASEAAILTNSSQIDPVHIFIAFLRVFPVLQKVLQENKISLDIVTESTQYIIERKKKQKNISPFDINHPYYKNGGIAKNLIFGWTFVLGHFSKDVTEQIAYAKDTFGIGHDNEIDELTSIVGKLSKNNSLLVGEAGVGKSSLIKGLAQRINRGNVPPQLHNKRIVQLDINGLIASAGNDKNIEQLIQAAMKELANSGNIILYIDEIQELIPAKAEKSGHSIAGIMLPYILESTFPIVGTINYSDYKKYFFSNESLRQSFEIVEVQPLSAESTLEILTSKIPMLEENYGIYITIPALTACIELAQRYINDRKLPDSAVGILESSCSWAQANGVTTLTNEHIAKVVSIQSNIPVESIDADEATKLMKLEEKIKSRVIGQDHAVNSIVEALKRARTDIRDPKRPIGVFLFLGPTGVGKTYLAKIIAEEYFENSNDIVRLDMSEYQEIESLSKMLDSATESNPLGQTKISLIDKIKTNPFSVVLFDEIEKAHPNILNIFLQLFDEGRLTSNLGETVSFRNAIIICTSNIGSRVILDSLEKDQSLWAEARDRAIIELKQAIAPELFNRFDEVVVFSPHDINNLTTIAEIQLQGLAKRLTEKGITLEWDKTIPMLIANKAFEPGMGARPIKRFIQQKIEGQIATELLEQMHKSGDTIRIKESWLK